MIVSNRRSFITGLSALIASPAIVKYDNLMKIAALRNSIDPMSIYDPILFDIIKQWEDIQVNKMVNDLIGCQSMLWFVPEFSE